MPDKHIGPTHIYEAVLIHIYRKPWMSSVRNYEHQASVQFFIKSREEIPKLYRQIAVMNKTQGFYDWGFKWESRGMVRRTTVEDSDWQIIQAQKEGKNIFG